MELYCNGLIFFKEELYMIIIDLDENRYYSNNKDFPEEYMNNLFNEYFSELYQEEAKKSRIKEIWKDISMNIPKNAVFIVKNAKQYYLTEDLNFEIVPKEFFEISNATHIILAECFQECYKKFEESMENYKEWDNTELSLITLYIDTKVSDNLIDYITRAYVKDITNIVGPAEEKFKEILKISLKEKMYNTILPRIVDLYKRALLASEPIMLIIRTLHRERELYAVTNKLKVKKVSYNLIERELEEIINRIIPRDTDFLVNRIYNYMMMPLKDVKPYIRINEVQNSEVAATLYLHDRKIPIVTNSKFKNAYTFTSIEPDADGYPYQSRYSSPKIKIYPTNPYSALNIMKKVNKTMFQNKECYVAIAGEKYEFVRNNGYDRVYTKSKENALYTLCKGKLTDILGNSHSCIIQENSSEFKKIKEEFQKAKINGCYAFFEIAM